MSNLILIVANQPDSFQGCAMLVFFNTACILSRLIVCEHEIMVEPSSNLRAPGGVVCFIPAGFTCVFYIV